MAIDKKAVSEFLWVAVPKIGAGLLQIQLNLLLTRALGPEQAGLLFVALTSVLLADAVFGAAFDLCVVRLATGEKNPEIDGLPIERTAIRLKLAAGATLAAAVALFGQPLARLLYRDGSQAGLLAWAALAFAALLLLRSVQTHFQVRRNFPYYGGADLANTLLRWGGVGILLAAGWATPQRVLILFATVPLGVTVAMLAGPAAALIAGGASWTAAKRLAKESGWFLASAAAGSATSRLDILLVSAWSGPREAGIFAAAANLTVPVQMIGQYLGLVFAPRILPLREQGRLASVYFRSQAVLAAAALLLWAGISAALAFAVPFVLGPAFESSRAVAFWLLVSAATAVVNFPWTISALLFLKPRLPALFDFAALPCLAVAYRLTIPEHGALGAAMVTAAYSILKLAGFQWAGANAVRQPPASPGALAQ